MAIRNILKESEDLERLTLMSREVVEFDDKLALLIDDMIDTMIDAHGCGLAAPQVGILKRVFIICVDGETVYEFVNPSIVRTRGKQTESEGCLSIPGFNGFVDRPKSVVVKAKDRKGVEFVLTVDGLFARAVCHENDHLDGILFRSRVVAIDN